MRVVKMKIKEGISLNLLDKKILARAKAINGLAD